LHIIGTLHRENPIFGALPVKDILLIGTANRNFLDHSDLLFGKKIFSKRGIFHHFESSSISLLTVASGSSNLREEITLKVDGFGSHLSFQIQVLPPLPTHHTNPSLSKSQELKILLRAKDGLLPILASTTELPG
jgi:hypothetical protein